MDRFQRKCEKHVVSTVVQKENAFPQLQMVQKQQKDNNNGFNSPQSNITIENEDDVNNGSYDGSNGNANHDTSNSENDYSLDDFSVDSDSHDDGSSYNKALETLQNFIKKFKCTEIISL